MTTQTTEQPTTPEQVSTSTAAKVLALVAAYEAGKISAETFARTAAAITYAGKVIAARYADVLVSTLANLRPRGITPYPRELIRLEAAYLTVLSEDPESVPERSERIAAAEPLHEHRRALQQAMREQGFTQWRRVVKPDACEVCAPLAGKVYDISEGFRDHPQCECTLEPYGEIGPTSEQQPDPEPLVRITKTITTR